MHGMRTVRLVTESTGELIVEYGAVTHPAIGERVRYKDNFLEATGVLHSLQTERDSRGSYARLDVVIIKCKQEPLY